MEKTPIPPDMTTASQLADRILAGGAPATAEELLDLLRHAPRASEVSAALRALGFAYVSLDLQGYRTGSLNETLSKTT